MDTSGGSVAGADVQIIDTRTEAVVRKLPVGSDGSFLVPLLPPGTYSVVVNKSGFTEAKADGIEVRVTETTKVTITLKPGAVSEEVEISAQITTVDTTRATTGQSLSTETVRQLPLATQNFQQLLTLSSGAQDRLNNATQLGRGDVRVFVNTSTRPARRRILLPPTNPAGRGDQPGLCARAFAHYRLHQQRHVSSADS